MKASLLLLFLGFGTFVFSQDVKILFLKQKQNVQQYDLADFVSERSLERRRKKNIQMDSYDLALDPDIIQSIRQYGKVLNTSKWLNAVSIETVLSDEFLMQHCDFIDRIHTIENQKHPSSVEKLIPLSKELDYGDAIDQMEQINLKCLHDMGYTGQGMYVGIIDAGFRNMETNGYFDIVYSENRILDTHNFVSPTSTVYDISGHGTTVTSAIVAEKTNPNSYAGTAVDVDLALYLSEDDASETEIEEFNLVAALERCDSVGVDVVNISLGYFEFDPPNESHVYADLDGVTTIAAKGVNIAAAKGMFVAVSAGNSGPSNISTPCDADSAFCVGAVDEFGVLATFSSLGPSADGQVKPDVVARGDQAWLIDEWGSTGQGNGTSFSSPIIAGATACLIQANPTKSVAEIMQAIRQSASQYNSPDEFKGYGIPDYCLAHELLNSDSGLDYTLSENIKVYPVPATTKLYIDGVNTAVISARIYDVYGKLLDNIDLTKATNEIVFDISGLPAGVYTVVLTGSVNESRKRFTIID